MAMDRILQHANLALTNPKDEPSSALFPYMIAVAVTVMVIVLGIQHIYLWICRVYFGREPPPEPISGEEIMANLTEEQRRAVLQAILSKVCKVRLGLFEKCCDYRHLIYHLMFSGSDRIGYFTTEKEAS